MKPCIYILATLTLLSSCVTTGRHELMEDRVTQLEAFQTTTQKTLKQDVVRLEDLNKQLDAATSLLTKRGASLAASVDGNSEDVTRMRGRIESVEFFQKKITAQIDSIKRYLDEKFGAAVFSLPENLPKEAGALYQDGVNRFKAGKLDAARAVLRHFIKNFGQHPGIATAKLTIGRILRKQRRFKIAMKEFHEVWKQFPKQPEAATALLLTAETLKDSGSCKKALAMYRFLVKSYRNSPEAIKAKPLSKERCPK
ncbi:MAG TPA: tetratricopeptide repeat protein [Myxococcales bacterium]|nr:tetratricopeptide repeat protein [Myxococcales bacterium]HIN86889.1 tetratricopeptide repeat protein [Myxococcales bacterium]